ncbi:dethiobiotin synthase [uncultured Clostridium sp.]|jgi:dethiobiotin synthetase|uniref:dethiobiotin synthase n=1 Tax=uncultured Clostridium sp. TaxID=59620 RepID=UPI00263500A2|nr:dethiobiotin synthase [uncultured Clostridium sp.]
MDKGIFVLGTDTDIGKTFVSGLLLKKLREDGVNAGYFKAVLSGAEIEKERLIPGDCKFVCEVSGLKKDYDKMVSYTFKNPVSPHLASIIEGVDISFEKIKNDYINITKEYDFTLCEGSGGVICPISLADGNEIMLEDIVKMTNLPVILVARAGLGTINHTFLTVNYLKQMGVSIKGIILNNFDKNSLMHNDNKKIIMKLTGIENIVTIPETIDINDLNLDDLGRLIYG